MAASTRFRAPMWAVPPLFAGLLAACGPAEAPSPSVESTPVERSSAPTRPGLPLTVDNVLLITVDTLRADHLGLYGDQRGASPTLDRLGAAGRVFDEARAHNVVTLPSHANILTGLLPYEHGIRDNSGFRLAGDVPTAATLFEAAGFATAAVVGAYPLDRRYGLARGFELYDDDYPEGAGGLVEPERRGDEVVARGLEWWRRHAGRRRFLWLHLYDPHAPYAAPQEVARRFPEDPYLAEVAAVDAFLEPLLAPFLDGREPPTLVIFTADHGEALGDHGEMTHGLFAYEETLAVPLMLWAEGLPAGRDQVPARHVDLLPTMLAAAGVEPPAELPGRSLLAAATGGGDTYFEALTATFDRGWAPLRGVVSGGEKYIDLPIPELYDLAADPHEAVNLAADRRSRLRRLASQLPTASAWPPERGVVDAAEERALRSLGYLGGRAATRESYDAEDDPKRLVHLDRKVHELLDHYHRGRLEEAERLAAEVIAERPDMGVAYYYRAQVLLESDRLAEAIDVMSEARRRGVATPALDRQLGLSLADVGRFEEAVRVLAPLAESEDVDGLNALGLVLSEGGDQAAAARVLQRVFTLDERNPKAHETLALVALRRQDWAAAQRQAERALALNEELDQAWNFLGTALFQLGDQRGALRAWQEATRREAGNFDALFNLAIVAGELGERAIARRALDRFVREAPPARYGSDIEQARRWLQGLGG